MATYRARTPHFWLVFPDRVAPLPEGSHVVGRGADVDFCLTDDPELSRHHARLEVTSMEVFIEDLDSRNGTWVDGRRVTGRTPVPPGAALRVGSTRVDLQTAGSTPHKQYAPTSPEVPAARAARAAEATELPTQREVGLDVGLLDAERAISEGRISDARRLLYEYMVLFDKAAERVPEALLDRAAGIARKLSELTGEPRHSAWIPGAYERAGRPLPR